MDDRTEADRNTPAYAGKTDQRTKKSEKIEKHPRLRREDGPKRCRLPSAGETPPLTRGRRVPQVVIRFNHGNTPAYAGKTDFNDVLTLRKTGNTPAYAGKTGLLFARPLAPQKHPRLRGEDSYVEH